MLGRHRPVALGALVAVVGALALLGAGGASAKTTWLCRPGMHHDPCAAGLSTTVYPPGLTGAGRVVHPKPLRRPDVDCFYAYPTVSDQKGAFADLHVDPEERSIALYQAARYAQVCHVWAPMYRQGTLKSLFGGGSSASRHSRTAPAFRTLSAAFADFLAHRSRGRPFVVIAHSQGAFLMRQILAAQVDRVAGVRRRMLSAILLGGDVLTRTGSRSGGDFDHIPACRSATDLGCVIAYSTFGATPPSNALFGVAPSASRSVLCVDPARLLHRRLADPIYPSAPFAPGTLIATGIDALHVTLPRPATTWVSSPGAYATRCTTGAGPHVLLATPVNGAPAPTPSPTPAWGLHLLDANIELGDLVTIVQRETKAYEEPTGELSAPHTRS